uniref:Uncharacterized protein n=1 Tax=Klebsiella pneumoniae TaxID=573 RepID=A0A2P1BPA8_KLEPN|nr:hypothetical protein [Klebsiella pneumoniae]
MPLCFLLPAVAARGALTSSVKCAFQFQRAEYLPEGGIFHRGDVDTAPFAVTSGDMTPESSESGINLRCGDICAQNARMTTGFTAPAEGEK